MAGHLHLVFMVCGVQIKIHLHTVCYETCRLMLHDENMLRKQQQQQTNVYAWIFVCVCLVHNYNY